MAGNLGFAAYLVEDALLSPLVGGDYRGRPRTADEVHAMSLANLDGEYCTVVQSAAMLRRRPGKLPKPVDQRSSDLPDVHPGKAHAGERAGISGEVAAGEGLRQLDDRVDRRRRHAGSLAQRTHRHQPDRHILGDVFVAP